MIKVVIFDLDGTLVDAYPAVAASVNHTLKTLKLPQRTFLEIKYAVGMGDKHLLAHFVGAKRKTQAIKIYRANHGEALLAKGGVCFLPQVKELLKYLKAQGYCLAIATNRPQKFTQIILEKLKMAHFFDMVLCADTTKMPKPQPGMLLQILKKMKLIKAQAIFVGDMGIDVKTGKRAGIRTVAVATGSSTLSELKLLQPWQIISRIGKLKNIIKSLPLSAACTLSYK